MRAHLLLAGVAGLLVVAVKAQADDLKALQGTWSPISAILNGQKFPAEMLQTISLIISDHTYRVTVNDQTDAGTFKLNVHKKPREMDLSGTEGPNKDQTILCIYEVSGDWLRVCYTLDGKERPKEFQAEPGSGQFLAIYKRVKP